MFFYLIFVVIALPGPYYKLTFVGLCSAMGYDSEPMKPLHIRNITRFTYEFTSFLGWRVTICRKSLHFTRYFSDRQYGSMEASLAAALALRERLLELLRLHPSDPATAFRLCEASCPPPPFPRGVGPIRLKRGRRAGSDDADAVH